MMRHFLELKIPPRFGLSRWLIHTNSSTPPAFRDSIISSLYRRTPIFSGGALNSVAVALLLAARLHHWLFWLWALGELTVLIARFAIIFVSRRAEASRSAPPFNILVAIEITGALVIGFGIFICTNSTDVLTNVVAWICAAGVIGETCWRNVGAPRLTAAVLTLAVAPSLSCAIHSGDRFDQLAALQIAVLIGMSTGAAARLRKSLLESMRAERENDHRARHDKLTGLLNRAGLDREMEILLSENHNANITLFFLDLDGFKTVNDRHGHLAGDQVLRVVGEKLLSMTGPNDVVARIGGDEFVVISALEYLRPVELGNAISSAILKAAYGKIDATISVSIGVAQSLQHGRSLATLLATADRALYAAKSSGKSRLIIASADEYDSANT